MSAAIKFSLYIISFITLDFSSIREDSDKVSFYKMGLILSENNNNLTLIPKMIVFESRTIFL